MVCKKTPKTDSGNRRVAVPLSVIENLKKFHEEMTGYFEKTWSTKIKTHLSNNLW